MKRFGSSNIALATIFAAGLVTGFGIFAIGGCKGGGGGGSIATINGESISKDEWYRAMEFKPQVNVLDNAGNPVAARVSESIGYQAFQDLLRQRLILQLAQDEGVYPTDEDIKTELEFRNKLDGNFIPTLTANGLKLEEIKSQLRVELASEKLLTKNIKVSDLEIDRYIKNNPAAFIKPPTASMFWILVNSKEQQKLVDENLKGGQSFMTVSQQYSVHQDAKSNQRFPVDVINQMPAPVRAIAESLQEAKTSDWLQLSDGYAKFYMEKKTPAERVKIDGVLRDKLRRQLALERGKIGIDLDTRLVNKMKSSKINVNLESLEPRWKKALERLKDIEERKNSAK